MLYTTYTVRFLRILATDLQAFKDLLVLGVGYVTPCPGNRFTIHHDILFIWAWHGFCFVQDETESYIHVTLHAKRLLFLSMLTDNRTNWKSLAKTSNISTVHLVYCFHFNQQCKIYIFILSLYYNHTYMFRYICIIFREFQSSVLTTPAYRPHPTQGYPVFRSVIPVMYLRTKYTNTYRKGSQKHNYRVAHEMSYH